MDTFTTTNIWQHWASTTYTATTSSIIASNNIWLAWNGSGSYVTSTVAPTSAIWSNWVRLPTVASYRVQAPVQQPVVETPAQIAAREAVAARYAAEQQIRIEANARAEKLLIENISPQQAESLRLHGHFFVEVGNKKYRIDRAGKSGNIRLIGADGKVQKRYCIHDRYLDADSIIPECDNMLAQKLLLETDEAAFLRIANAS